MTKVLLAGATGLVGGVALRLLLADTRVSRIVAPTRRALAPRAKLLKPIVDSTTLPHKADWWSVDSVICALGTTRARAGSAAAFRAIDYDYALAVATRARAAGATAFALTSSVGAKSRSWFLYPRTKGEWEEAIGRLDFATLTILRPGFIGGDRVERRPVERIIAAVLRRAGPILPASARISPAPSRRCSSTRRCAGRHIVDSAEIARASEAVRDVVGQW